jgi:hypothetical protein
MPPYLTFSENQLTSLDTAIQAGLQALAAEAMGWQPLGPGAYLRLSDTESEENVIHVVGVPHTSLAGLNVLLLT